MEIWEITNEKDLKNLLRKAIIFSINEKNEFGYLEKLCERNHVQFNYKIIDYCLDRYIELRKLGEPQFNSKYASLWRTAWKILYS